MKSPVASTRVAISGADMIVGSILTAVASIGIDAPTALAQVQMTRIETPTVMASGIVDPQRSARPKPTTPSRIPRARPLPASRRTTRQKSRRRISPTARPRTIVVTVWEPELPPVPMSSGMKKESATTFASSDSKWRSTVPVRVSVTKRRSSQLNLARTLRNGLVAEGYFATTPFRNVRARFNWLLLLFVTETLTGTVLRHFEGELAKVVALS